MFMIKLTDDCAFTCPQAVFCLDRCLDHSPACIRFKVLKAEALSYLGRQQDAQELAK